MVSVPLLVKLTLARETITDPPLITIGQDVCHCTQCLHGVGRVFVPPQALCSPLKQSVNQSIHRVFAPPQALYVPPCLCSTTGSITCSTVSLFHHRLYNMFHRVFAPPQALYVPPCPCSTTGSIICSTVSVFHHRLYNMFHRVFVPPQAL